MEIRTILKEIWEILLIFLHSIYASLMRIIWPGPGKSLLGEIALVTGAGHGIGRELSLQLAKEGAKVVCWDINEETAEETVQNIRRRNGINGIACSFKCNVADREEVKRVAQKTRTTMGKVTMLFNNAGIMPCKSFMQHSQRDIEQVFQVNVYSQFWTLQEFLPDFIEQKKGHIVSMSSTAGLTGTPNLTAYCSTKYAVRGLMDALLLELRQQQTPQVNDQVNLTVVHPFVVNTGLAQKPSTRFTTLIPFTEASEAASIILTGVKNNDFEVFVPQRLFYLFGLSHILPLKVKLALFDFLGCGVDAQGDI